jgi:hypothetical protein
MEQDDAHSQGYHNHNSCPEHQRRSGIDIRDEPSKRADIRHQKNPQPDLKVCDLLFRNVEVGHENLASGGYVLERIHEACADVFGCALTSRMTRREAVGVDAAVRPHVAIHGGGALGGGFFIRATGEPAAATHFFSNSSRVMIFGAPQLRTQFGPKRKLASDPN